jgi:hypothetical protein
MITDISLVNSKVQITEGANHPHVYSVSDDHDYYFDADSVLRLIIRSTTYTIAFAEFNYRRFCSGKHRGCLYFTCFGFS